MVVTVNIWASHEDDNYLDYRFSINEVFDKDANVIRHITDFPQVEKKKIEIIAEKLAYENASKAYDEQQYEMRLDRGEPERL
jgi:hypothetical protein